MHGREHHTRWEPALRDIWTQVDNGLGEQAGYRVKYAESPLEDWKNATIGCHRTLKGNEIGDDFQCTVEGLDADTRYDFQLRSFRTEDGLWVGAVLSNVATGETRSGATDPAPTVVRDLEVTDASSSTLTLRWTQVDDGTGEPADTAFATARRSRRGRKGRSAALRASPARRSAPR